MYKTQKEIINKINSSNYKAFTSYDFLGLSSYKNISKSLELLEDEGLLKRARRGVYYKRVYNEELNIEVIPSLDDIAKAIAREYNWRITPSGNYVLNLLGIDTQVPSKVIYISNGPYREYEVGANSIIFKHSTSKEILSTTDNILIAIQAFKAVGKDNITDDLLSKINQFFNEEDKEQINKGFVTTSWIYEVLKRAACIK